MATVLVIDDDPNTLRLMRYMLERGGFQVELAGDGEDGLAKAFEQPPDLVITDVMMPGLNGYQVCERLRADPRTAHVPIIIIGGDGQLVDRQTALYAGADLVLIKPVTPDELVAKVKELLSWPRGVPPPVAAEILPGRIITAFSLRGGVGVTSLAANLAVALAQQYQDTISLIDLSLPTGHLAVMLNMRPKRTIAHLLAGRIDSEAIERHLVSHPSGVTLLAAPPVPPLPGAISADAIGKLLATFKPLYSYIVVDTASALDDVTLAVLNASDAILLVFSPEVLSVQTTLATRQAFYARGIAPERVVLVLNQTMPKVTLPLKTIEGALKQPIKTILPYEPRQTLAIAKGQPLLLSDPASSFAGAIKALASMVRFPPSSQVRRPASRRRHKVWE